MQNPIVALSQRSGLPIKEITALLADCDANQTSMNFCAWRDQIMAEQELEHLIAQKSAGSDRCKLKIEHKINAWKKHRDSSCRRSAEKEWGSGSMLPTAIAICITAETKRMIKIITQQQSY